MTTREPPPSAVIGYARAAGAGLVTRAPVEPPRVPIGARTAGRAARWFLLQMGGATALALGVVAVVDGIDAPGLVRGLTMLAAGLGILVLGYHSWGRVGERNLAELSAGYTTLVMPFGTFWRSSRRHRPGLGRRIPWDYSAVWILDPSGRRILASPRETTDPPGFYPSPNRPGRLELWTGAVWAGSYRPDPTAPH